MPYVGEYLDSFADADAVGDASKWIYVANQPVNVYMTTTAGPAAFNGTITLQGAMSNGPDEEGLNMAAVTAGTMTGNQQVNSCVPFVRLKITARTSGTILKSWILSRSTGK